MITILTAKDRSQKFQRIGSICAVVRHKMKMIKNHQSIFGFNASNFALDITRYRHTIKIFLARPFSTLATQYETSQNLI